MYDGRGMKDDNTLESGVVSFRVSVKVGPLTDGGGVIDGDGVADCIGNIVEGVPRSLATFEALPRLLMWNNWYLSRSIRHTRTDLVI